MRILTPDTFEDRLSRLIEEKGFSNYRIAKDIGISDGTIRFWRSGKFKPHGTNLHKLAEYLQVSPEWLLSGKAEHKPSYTDDVQRIAEKISKYGKNHPDGLEKIEQMVDIFTGEDKSKKEGTAFQKRRKTA